MIGLYVPGNSLLHRMPAGLKLLLLALAAFGVLLLRRPWQIGAALVGVAALYPLAGVGWLTGLRQLRPLLWIAPVLAVFQLVFAGWERAVMTTGALLANVALAALLTLTTTVTALLDTCQVMLRPFARFGVNPDRVGLLLALTIRCIPLVSGITAQILQARKARGVTGLRGSMFALAAPAVVRALRAADAMGEALTARGVDD